MRENLPIIRLKPDLGDDSVVARDGVVICFFMRRSHSEVAPAIWRALETYRRAIPAQALAWYGSEDGDTLPLDDKGWAHIRYKILERPWGMEWIVESEEDCGPGGGYHFEYNGRRLDDPMFSTTRTRPRACSSPCPRSTWWSTVLATARAGVGTGARAALQLRLRQPRHRRPAWALVRRAQLRPLLSRYPGLDINKLGTTSRVIGTRARGAYWLTFLGQPLLGQLGGLEGLRAEAPVAAGVLRAPGERAAADHAGGVAGGDGHLTAGVCAGVPGRWRACWSRTSTRSATTGSRGGLLDRTTCAAGSAACASEPLRAGTAGDRRTRPASPQVAWPRAMTEPNLSAPSSHRELARAQRGSR